MKNSNSIHQIESTKQNVDDFNIEVLLRRGTTSTVFPPKLASEMICQDCGGNNGHTWSENGKKLWFYGNNKCLKTDTEITKQREQQIWWKNHQLALKKAEGQKAKKKWDGK